ncbi:MAG: hypothetical protein WKF43_06035 [Acidimicrobiales bacterium]
MFRRSLAAIFALVVAVWFAVPPPAGAVQVGHDVVVSADPVDWTPHVLDGTVLDFVQVGDLVIVGGQFSQVRNAGSTTILQRRNVFAYSASTGEIAAAFVPQVNASVKALATDGSGTNVFLGGYFSTVNGVASRGVALLDVATGLAVAGFSAVTNGAVNDITVRAGRLYVGGAFSQIGGVPRTNLAAVDTATGVVDPNLDVPVAVAMIGANANIEKLDVTPDASTLVVIGNFTMVGGLPRTQVALVQLGTPAVVSPWETVEYGNVCNPLYYTYMRDVDISLDGTYMVIVTTGSTTSTGKLCDAAARWDLTVQEPGKEPIWADYTGNDTLLSVAVTNAAVYVGGHQRWQNNPSAKDEAGPGAVERSGVAALDPLTGVPLKWNPGRTRGVGAEALVATETGLLIGSDTDSLGGEFHGRLGFFPLAGGTVNPTPTPTELPVEVYSAGADGSLTSRLYDGTTVGEPDSVSGPTIDGVDWTSMAGAFMVNGTVYIAAADGRLVSRTFDGTTFGPEQDLASWLDWSAVDAVAYIDGRLIYHKISVPNSLYTRRFAIESGIIGGQEFLISSTGVDGINWGNTNGLTVVGDQLYATKTTGNLRRTDLADWAPVPGTTVTVSGPAVDGLDWSAGRLFAGPIAPK